MSAIFKREFGNYFCSFIGYAFLTVFVLVTAIYFSIYNVMSLSPDYHLILSNVVIVLLILVPIITMRLFSEESKQKTDQLLLTAPVKVYEIVLAKFFAASALFAMGLIITLIFPIILSFFGNVPTGQIISAYVGFLFMGMCFIAVGIWVSSLTDNQVVAGIGTFGILFVLFMIEAIGKGVPEGRNYGCGLAILICIIIGLFVYNSVNNIKYSVISGGVFFVIGLIVFFVKPEFYDTFLYNFVMSFAVISKFSKFMLGIFDFTTIVYYITFAAGFIYLTVRSVEKKRWS